MRTIDELRISQWPWRTFEDNWIESADGNHAMSNAAYARNQNDARLIAAAPDMYKALYDIVEYIDNHSTGDDDLTYFVAPIAEKALAKASGEVVSNV